MKRRGRPLDKVKAAAKAAGRIAFMAEKPCKRCGERRRYTASGGCVTCAINRGVAFYKSIKDDPKALEHYNRHHYGD